MSARKKTRTTTRPETGTMPSPVAEPAAGAPALRTDTEKTLWAALGNQPGSTAAELADAAGIGGSTARRILSRWATAGAAHRTRDLDNPRAAEHWSPTTEPASDAPEPAPVPDTTGTGQGADTGPQTAANPAPAVPAAARTDADTAAPAPDTQPTGTDAAAAKPESPQPLAPGALRGMVEDFLIDNPGGEFTPHEIGKKLSRSSGAVHNALVKLTALNTARQTCEQPKKFALAAPAQP